MAENIPQQAEQPSKRGKKKNKGMEIKITLWNTVPEKQKLQNLAEEYTAFRNTNLSGFDIILTPGSM